jgi:hypothetical protein
MAPFYNLGDQNIYNSGQYFIPQEKYRLNYNAPVIEEEETSSIGIPSTNSFMNFANNQNNNRIFDPNAFTPYSAQPSGSFVTNRTDYSRSGYLPGTEPEETYLDKFGNLIKTGIGLAIPGGNFLMNMADNFAKQNRLNATDNAFIDMQIANQERNIHGFGNLPNQDRYGYNKTSMFGNYADKVKERVEIANDRISQGKDLRPIDKYYLEKEKEFKTIQNQIDFNNFVRQRMTANKIREAEKKGIKLGPTGIDVHGGITTGGDGDGGFGGYANVQAYDAANKATYDRIRDMHGGGGGNMSASDFSDDSPGTPFRRGGLASLL